MTEKLFIPILLGTVRRERRSEKVAQYLLGHIQNNPEIETKLIDIREMNLPMDDEGEDLKEKNHNYQKTIIQADGLIIVSPEYNHGYPGSLKRALDILLEEYIHKAVGLVGVSDGNWGGLRMIEQLIGVVRELGLVATFTDLQFPKIKEFFNEDGTPKDSATDSRVEKFLTELVWLGRTLKWGRKNLPSKFHT